MNKGFIMTTGLLAVSLLTTGEASFCNENDRDFLSSSQPITERVNNTRSCNWQRVERVDHINTESGIKKYRVVYVDKGIYEGPGRVRHGDHGVVEFVREGVGTMTYTSRCIEHVCFEDDTIVCENGDVYNGEWVDDAKHGHGKMTYANGNQYEGSWSDNHMREGVMKYADGDIYEGHWMSTCFDKEKDVKQGHGVMRYADGTVYDGGWNFDEREGKGTLKGPNGETIHDGYWLKGGECSEEEYNDYIVEINKFSGTIGTDSHDELPDFDFGDLDSDQPLLPLDPET
jgi:hypothetical protein